MDEFLAAMRAAHAAGASADVLMALFEALQKAEQEREKVERERVTKIEAEVEARRAKDRERKRRGIPRNSTEFHGSARNSTETPGSAKKPAADPPPAAGPPSAKPLGIESVDNSPTILKKGLTKQGDSNDACLSSFPNLFSESSNSQDKKEVDTRAREAADSLFAKFWQAYPHKVGKRDAAACFQRVLKSRIVGIDDLMAGLARYVAKTDDRPWCNPSTWLNQGRWDDQPADHYQNGGGNGFQTNRGAGGAVRMRIALARKRAAASNPYNHTDQEEGGFAAPLQSRNGT